MIGDWHTESTLIFLLLTLQTISFQLDVHAFLFSDMLLLCKVLTKKSHSSNPEARMKIIRQPFIVDRIMLSEINKDGQIIGESNF